MPSKKKFDPSWNFSAAILGIGVISLAGALLFSNAMQSVHMQANAAEQTCSGGLEMCMKFAEQHPQCDVCVSSDLAITSAACQACASEKAECQYGYNACTDEGGKIHAW